MRELNVNEVQCVHGGIGGALLYGSSGGIGGMLGAYVSPFVAPNAALQVLMALPMNIFCGAFTAMVLTAAVASVVG